MIKVDVKPVKISEGEKIWVTTNGEFYYGFGDKEPSVWHMYYTIKEAIVFNGDFGAVWVKSTSDKVVYLNVSVAKA